MEGDPPDQTEAKRASLVELFGMGREGILGMMQAHLDGKKWHGEKVSAHAFRQCFRIVAQAVRGFNLPSDQRNPARQVAIQELIKAQQATNESLAMQQNGDSPTKSTGKTN